MAYSDIRHIITACRTRPLQSTKDLPALASKGDVARDIYGDTTVDYALPQNWVDAMQSEHNFDPRPCVVWGYPKGSLSGLPFPLTQEAEAALIEALN